MTQVFIDRIGPDDVASLHTLVAACPFKPYPFASGSMAVEIDAWRLTSLVEQTRAGGAVVARVDGRAIALAVHGPLPWESRVLGRRVHGVRDVVVDPSAEHLEDALHRLLTAVCDAAIQGGAETLHCKRTTRDVALCHALQRAGFLWMDTQLLYAMRLDRRATGCPDAEGVTVRLAGPEDAEAVVRVARGAFDRYFGRFHADTRLPRASAVKVYEEWMRSGLAGYADFTVVAETEGRIAALSMWRRPSPADAALPIRIGHCSIVAVAPEFHRRGLCTAVLACGMARMADAADWIFTSTHVNNYGAQRVNARLGWQIEDATHAFHTWFTTA